MCYNCISITVLAIWVPLISYKCFLTMSDVMIRPVLLFDFVYYDGRTLHKFLVYAG